MNVAFGSRLSALHETSSHVAMVIDATRADQADTGGSIATVLCLPKKSASKG
jgi:hypothetical protein